MNEQSRREALKKILWSSGIAVSAPTLTSLLQSCQPALDWKPMALSSEQARILTTITDVVLPKTASLGGVEAGVPQFIDGILANIYSDGSRNDFLTELEALNENCKENHGKAFSDASDAEQLDYLTRLDKENTPAGPNVWGSDMIKKPPRNFFGQLKGMIVWAFGVSEAVGSEVLSYDPIPGTYLPCMPLEEVGNAWTF